ncbi:MAG TPA: amidase family protein, partial [Holophaga sp.]|nr:amidase family protein [Holophaga sp.]
PLAMYMADIFTVTTSLAALPCLSIPAGFAAPADAPGPLMPVGMQLIGPPLSDVRLLEWACAFQQVTDHHARRPTLAE